MKAKLAPPPAAPEPAPKPVIEGVQIREWRPGQTDPIYTDEEIAKIAIRFKGVVSTVAKVLGVNRATVIAWRRERPAVDQAFREGRAEMVDDAENKLIIALQQGEPWAVKYVLSRAERLDLLESGANRVVHEHHFDGTVVMEISEHERLQRAAETIRLFSLLGIPVPGTATVIDGGDDAEADPVHPALPAPEASPLPPAAQ